jgi:tetratricopeptide (TPR) repeat protein
MTHPSMRDDAKKMLKSSLSYYDYAKDDPDFLPLRLARRWLEVFESADPDYDKAREIYEEALPSQKNYGLIFFTSCNHMQFVLREMWRRKLGAGGNDHMQKAYEKMEVRMTLPSMRYAAGRMLNNTLGSYENAKDDPEFPPLRLAKRWFEIFQATEPDYDKAREVCEEALPNKDKYGATFSTICADMQFILEELGKTMAEIKG